jgi:threonine aldolase
MRQSGYLAAAGLYALQNNINRLEIDHRRAKELGSLLGKMPWVANVEPVETNILIFGLQPSVDEKLFMEKLKQKGILISSMGHGKLRIVTHLDYKEVMHEYVIEVFSKLQF